MSVKLYTQQGVDFDTWFGLGTGSQYVNIYGDSGQDIGQRYYAGSGGPATGWYSQDGQDLCNHFCGYGYGIYRVTGYPWNTGVNWEAANWTNWLKSWVDKKTTVKCVSGITNDAWYRNVDSDFNYSLLIFGYSPVSGGVLNFNYSKTWQNKWHNSWSTMDLYYIEVNAYCKGVVLRPRAGAGGGIVTGLSISISQAGQNTDNYFVAAGIANDDNNPAYANYGWSYGNCYLHL